MHALLVHQLIIQRVLDVEHLSILELQRELCGIFEGENVKMNPPQSAIFEDYSAIS